MTATGDGLQATGLKGGAVEHSELMSFFLPVAGSLPPVAFLPTRSVGKKKPPAGKNARRRRGRTLRGQGSTHKQFKRWRNAA
jgi:hypothetical protein